MKNRPTINKAARAMPINRILLRREEAAQSLGVSVDHFDKRVRPEVPSTKSGRLTLFSPKHLAQWADDNTEAPPIRRI